MALGVGDEMGQKLMMTQPLTANANETALDYIPAASPHPFSDMRFLNLGCNVFLH